MNHALFIFESTQFTSSCDESSYNLLSLIADDFGISINQDSFVIAHQRNAAEPGDQWFLVILSDQLCFKAFPAAVWRLDGGLKAPVESQLLSAPNGD